jgi:hypothetical protein
VVEEKEKGFVLRLQWSSLTSMSLEWDVAVAVAVAAAVVAAPA